jgi:hypothetical protein
MKKILVLVVACVGLGYGAFAQDSKKQKVAVYVTGAKEEGTNEFVGAYLVDAIVQSSDYIAVERTSDFLKELSKEQGYQQSGAVDDDQISRLGKQFGVQLVCIAKIANMGNKQFVSARLIDVETATVKNSTKPFTFAGSEIETICVNVVTQLFSNVEIPAVQQKETGTVANSAKGRILYDKKGKYYYFSNTKGEMNDISYELFMKENCTEAYDVYCQGKKGKRDGQIWLYVGIPACVLIVGVIPVTVGIVKLVNAKKTRQVESPDVYNNFCVK